jgi:hypothetical protein
MTKINTQYLFDTPRKKIAYAQAKKDYRTKIKPLQSDISVYHNDTLDLIGEIDNMETILKNCIDFE